jgi:hypothetical protein
MGPALYVDIDADLFSSTWTALDWLFREGLMKPGTVIGYVHYLHCLPACPADDLPKQRASTQVHIHTDTSAFTRCTSDSHSPWLRMTFGIWHASTNRLTLSATGRLVRTPKSRPSI